MAEYDELVKELRGEYGYDTRKYIRVMKAAADAIEELSKPRWIPVTERLPEKNGPYLCAWKASADGKSYIARVLVWRVDMGWMNSFDEPVGNVTHWMPLPQPPKEEI